MTSEIGRMRPPAGGLNAQAFGLYELEDEDEPLDILDLPQLYTRPSAAILLSILAHLSSEPPSWDSRSGTSRSPLSSALISLGKKKRQIRSEGLPEYLTRIVGSTLAWIEDDNQKEQVWAAASQRLAERSGRSAMSDISRTFLIPVGITGSSSGTCSDGHELSTAESVRAGEPGNYLELTLREPALVADSLGFKTWASSYLLAKRIGILQPILPLLHEDNKVLELGSGTGLVGLAVAAVLKAHVILTDLPEIVPNLTANAHANASCVAGYGGKADTAVLDWASPESFRVQGVHDGAARTFPLIFAADPIYSPEHPGLLVNAVRFHLKASKDARVVVEMPLREAYRSERDDFTAKMVAIGLQILDTGEEVGFDDWSSGQDDEQVEVHCWWSVWGWR